MIDPDDPFRLVPDALRCPYPHYEALREQGPAVWSEELTAFVISGHEDAAATLRRPDLASSRRPTGPGLAALTAAAIERSRASGQLSELAASHLRAPTPRTVFTIDPPEHSQMRKLISRILSPSRARAWEPLIRAEADQLARDLAHAGRTDAMATFARPLPERVILPLLRMPDHMLADLRRWTRAVVKVIGNPGATDADVVQMLEARAEMAAFFADHLQRARGDAVDDLVTALIDAVDDNGRALSEGERIGLLINFLVAGNETSIKATAATIRVLAEHPSIWATLKADRAKVPNFLEEVLRLEPPTQGMFRFLAADLELAGTTIPAGADVYVNFAAANRDPAVFPAPTEIVLDRPHPMRHLAFGQGPHTCLGAWLARLEITAGIEAMLDHVATISLAPGNTFEHEPSYLLHGLRRLDVDVVPEPGA